MSSRHYVAISRTLFLLVNSLRSLLKTLAQYNGSVIFCKTSYMNSISYLKTISYIFTRNSINYYK